ncbi:ATPase domain-containing protein [Salarchaeum sp. III]|uniref:ATPase domain-containing protein n=1 Tax=Salarchaeum sp. III TaxID=3107927 RepID=UPI002EDAB34E
MPDLYELGLDTRDRVNAQLGGGLPAGSLGILEGEHGSGKSVITQRFAYGICETGSTVTYVSTEETAASFIDQMESLDYGVVKHLTRENMLFLHADVDTTNTFSDVDAQRPLLQRLMDAETMWNSDVIIFDGFDSILLHDPHYESIRERGDEDDVMQNLISFFRKITSQGKTILLTVNPESLTDAALRPVRDVSDIYLTLSSEEVGNGIRRQMVVKKFAGMGNQVDDTIGYEVQTGRGLTIVTRTVA